MDILTDDDILHCKNVGIREDENGYMEYYCTLYELSCDDVMRCSSGCRYEKEKPIIEDFDE